MEDENPAEFARTGQFPFGSGLGSLAPFGDHKASGNGTGDGWSGFGGIFICLHPTPSYFLDIDEPSLEKR